ncbi:hypothetical protein AHF37_11478 [Paragonimus kellicotti]|nr:hypothetical protein AHF37_11478 [Paragonimus kellicotti]
MDRQVTLCCSTCPMVQARCKPKYNLPMRLGAQTARSESFAAGASAHFKFHKTLKSYPCQFPNYPEKGLYKPMEEPGHPDRFIFILIVGPPETYGEHLIQNLIILRNFIRVVDGALILNPYKLPKACGGSATTRISERSWIKVS